MMTKENEKCLFQGGLPDAEREMQHICRQDRNMASMEAAVSTIAVAVNEIKDGQKEVVQLMREVAVQGARVDTLTAAITAEIVDRKHVNDILFDRVHALEVAPEGPACKDHEMRIRELEQAPVKQASNRMTGVWGGLWGGIVAAAVALLIFFAEKK
jgi:hypothetical protein